MNMNNTLITLFNHAVRNDEAAAPKGRDMHNPVQAAGAARGLCAAPAFRAAQGRCIAENLCAARMQDVSPCIPALRSASLHLHGVINIQPLTGLTQAHHAAASSTPLRSARNDAIQ
jgi:hypothetical protein